MTKLRKLPDKALIGTYSFMNINVDLYVTTNDAGGASFSLTPEKAAKPRICVGIDGYPWWRVVSMLLHEANEMCMTINGQRFQNSQSNSMDHAGYTFIQSHSQFTEMCAEVGYFVSVCLPNLEKWHKAQEKWEAYSKKNADKPKRRSRRYGQRGIGMTSAWRTSFERFVADMGERPSKDHRLERIDTEGHYTKDNCRWVRDD